MSTATDVIVPVVVIVGLGVVAQVLADRLSVPSVLFLILATVVFQAGFARHISQALDVLPMRVIVGGGDRVGPEMTTLEAVSATLATLGNIGPGFGFLGPFGSYLDFP